MPRRLGRAVFIVIVFTTSAVRVVATIVTGVIDGIRRAAA